MKRFFLLCMIVLLLLAACGQAPDTQDADTDFTVTQQQLFPPEQAFDVEFEAFYEEFTAAVRGKDTRFIEGILDDEIMSSFGGVPGKPYFYDYWAYMDLWAKLGEIIALGGVYYQAGEYHQANRGKCFVAPYTFAELDGDAFEQYAVIGKDVPAHEKKSARSKVIASLDYNILEFHNSDEFRKKGPEDFVSVTLPTGETGYVQRKYLRSPTDYRLCIEQKDGEWKLLWLVAGD